MKVYSSSHDFDYSWEEVSTANWRKYCPWNKESGHVIAVDTLSRTLDPNSGVLRTERLITCRQTAPKWLQTFIGASDVSHVYEVSYVTPPSLPGAAPTTTTASSPSPSLASNSDAGPTPASLQSSSLPPPTADLPSPPQHPSPRSPSVTMISQNLTWRELLSVVETVTYTPSPSAPASRTRFEQNARVTALCGGWARIRERIEQFTVDRFGQNAEKGRVGFDEVLQMSRRVFGEEKLKEAARGGA